MNKRIFISFGLVALLLVIVIPLWAFNRDGSEKTATLPVGVLGVRDGAELSPLIGRGAGGRVAKGQATLGIPAKTVTAYTVR